MLKSYLQNRKQVTKLGNILSNPDQVINGVPQGSILGPTIFLIYINDLKNCQFKGHFNLYADDTVIYNSNANLSLLCQEMNEDLITFSKWAQLNRLTVNIDKTKFMVINSNRRVNLNLNICQNQQIYYDNKRWRGLIT